MLGGPEADIEMFSALVETILDAQGGDPDVIDQALAAHDDLDAYMVDLIEQKRLRPAADLLTDLVRAETDDGTLNDDEVLNIAVSVIMAGTDTTRNQLAIGLHLFADHPDQWAALDDEARLTSAVDELLRIAPIGHVLLRVPRRDLTINDLELSEGTMVVLDVGAAHRDPSALDTPDEFDVTRPGPANHLGFGHGHKYCLGASLAKAELVEGLRALRQRFETIEHTSPASWRRVGFVQGPLTLPIRLGATSADH